MSRRVAAQILHVDMHRLHICRPKHPAIVKTLMRSGRALTSASALAAGHRRRVLPDRRRYPRLILTKQQGC